MNPKWRRFAPLGLILALVAGLVSFVLWVLFQAWGLPLQISLALMVIGLAIFGVLDPDSVRRAFTGRQARYGSNTLIIAVAFIGILVVANYLVYQFARLYPDKTRWDLTANKENSLAPETVDVLSKLAEPVKAQAFFTKSSPSDSAQTLLERYRDNSKGKFTFEFVDPDAKPVAAREAGVPQGKDGVVSLQMGSRRELVDSITEQALTSALIRLFSNEKRSVYFLIGHGEHSLDSGDERAYATAKKSLEDRNYKVDTLNLRATLVIPEDAKLLVVAGPTQPLGQEEVTLISDFLKRGGALIVLEDPTLETRFGDSADPLADYVLNDWGIRMANDVIIQVAANQYLPYIQGFKFGSHAITSEVVETAPPVFIIARSVKADSAPEDVRLTELVYSMPFSNNCYPFCSWASTDLADAGAWLSGQKQTPNPPAANDLLGPVPLAVAGENTANASRLVVFGDSEFPSDDLYNTYGNGDLFINAVDWASGQESMINLTAKTNTQRMLVPPFSMAVTANLLLLVLVIGLPGAVVAAGGLAWLARRRRG